MTPEEFNFIVDKRCELIKSILSSKSSEYSTEKSRFHNFIAAGRKYNITPEEALLYMRAKHEVSIDDMIEWAKSSPDKLTESLIDEKIGDSINYLILLEGMLKERIAKTKVFP